MSRIDFSWSCVPVRSTCSRQWCSRKSGVVARVLRSSHTQNTRPMEYSTYSTIQYPILSMIPWYWQSTELNINNRKTRVPLHLLQDIERSIVHQVHNSHQQRVPIPVYPQVFPELWLKRPPNIERWTLNCNSISMRRRKRGPSDSRWYYLKSKYVYLLPRDAHFLLIYTLTDGFAMNWGWSIHRYEDTECRVHHFFQSPGRIEKPHRAIDKRLPSDCRPNYTTRDSTGRVASTESTIVSEREQ